MIGRYVGTTSLDRILDRLDADHMTRFTVINSPLNNLIRCLHTSSSFVYGVVLRQLTCRAHGMRIELYLRLKWLHRPVQCSRVFLTRGQNERCESSSSRQGPAHPPRPHCSYDNEDHASKCHKPRHDHHPCTVTPP